jgi:hypothetical protein
VALGVDADDRIREALRIAGTRGVPIIESSRTELDRLCEGPHHQGIALNIPAYEYADAEDLLVRASDAGVAALNAGKAYLNIHTSSFGSGEIRGFLAPVPEPGTTVLGLLSGAVLMRRRRSARI